MEEQPTQAAQPAAPTAAPAGDVEKNKGMAMVAYIIFFIPLLAAKDSKFAMYHANQGLLLFLVAVALNIIATVVPFLGWFIIGPLAWIAVLVLAVMGIVNASKGEMKPLPIIGNYTILK